MVTSLLESIARRLAHTSEQASDADAAARYEAMLGRDRPLAERQAEATRLSESAPIRKLPPRRLA